MDLLYNLIKIQQVSAAYEALQHWIWKMELNTSSGMHINRNQKKLIQNYVRNKYKLSIIPIPAFKEVL